MMSEANPPNRFEAFLAICIAVATVAGAILAARAAVYNDAANDADQAGLSSAIDLALTQASVEARAQGERLSAIRAASPPGRIGLQANGSDRC
jgi:hypothetical protein